MSFDAYEVALELNRKLRPVHAKLHRVDRKEAAQLKDAAKSMTRNLREGNRRLGRDLVAKVLRATPKAELKLVPQQTAYPQTVRQAAKRMLQA